MSDPNPLSNVEVVSGGHGANTVVMCNGVPIEGVIALRFEIESASHVGLLTLTIEGAEVDVDALRIQIDGIEPPQPEDHPAASEVGKPS